MGIDDDVVPLRVRVGSYNCSCGSLAKPHVNVRIRAYVAEHAH